MSNITLGTDPELFAVGQDQQKIRNVLRTSYSGDVIDRVIPGYYALGIHDVENPVIRLPHGDVRPDGAAVEYTVDPTNDVQELIQRMHKNLDIIDEFVGKHGCRLSIEPYAYVDPWFIDQLDESYGKACSLQIFGCNPEVCIYDDIEEPERPDPKSFFYRTTGAHIHIGVGQRFLSDILAVSYLTAMLDAVIGTAGTYLCESEQAKRRKDLYGLPGLIRTSMDRGTVEYRCLPAQVFQTPELAKMFFIAAQNVADHMVGIYETHSQREAIEYFRSIVGDFEDIMRRADAIVRHDIDACLHFQLEMATARVPGNMGTHAIVGEMQAYRHHMPNHFNVMWGRT